jgi:hypothetical protein
MNGNEFVQYVIIPLSAAIVGAIIGAVLAFRYQRTMEIQRDKRGLMQMLMAYRTIGAVEIDWVKALNMIDIVFHDNKEIKRLFRSYMFHTDVSRYSTGHHQTVLVELLVEIGKTCGYTELTEADIRDGYNPKALRHIYAEVVERLMKESDSDESLDAPTSTNPPKSSEKVEAK